MKQVLYRAKRKSDSKWVEGYYVKAKYYLDDSDVHAIFPVDVTLYPHSEFSYYEEIIPETLGRLLAEPCWNGDLYEQRFFQGDIIAVWRSRWSKYDNELPDTTALVIDEWSISENGLGRWFPQDTTTVRVIGNAYDNPDLLRGHEMSRLICGLNDFPEDYTERHRRIMNEYGIHGAHACCYICNFENDYICHEYNGGCDRFEECVQIHVKECLGQATDVGDK